MNKHITKLKAIRKKCLDCCCNQILEVRLCQVPECALYPYRFGKNPARKGMGGKGNPIFLKRYRKQLQKGKK